MILSNEGIRRALKAGELEILPEPVDEILHAPQFQRLEACWRGLERACRDLRACRAVSLELLPTSRKELKERFHGRVFEPEYEGRGEVPLAAVYFDFQFSHTPRVM